MRKLLASIGLLIAPLLPMGSLHAQETTVVVGTAGNITATNSLAGNTSTESLSTAQVDGVLRVVAPGAFGQNFTRDRANKVFADFANLRAGLAASLFQIIASQPNIRQVYSVNVIANALNLRLSQKTNSVSGELGSISTRVSLLADVDGLRSIVCPSVNVTFDVKNIRAFGDYNFISGDVSGTNVTYDLVIVSASCNGLLGGLFNPTSGARSQITSAIEGQINTQIAFVNMQRLFSLSDFANGLRYYGNETIISPLVNRAINVFRELVNDAAINTPGIVLDFKVEFAANAAQQNKISIFASSAPVASANLPPAGDRIAFSLPPNSSGMDIYGRDSLSQSNWKFLGTASSSPIYFRDLSNLGSTVPVYIVTSRSSVISGLDSFPILVKESNGAGVGAGRK